MTRLKRLLPLLAVLATSTAAPAHIAAGHTHRQALQVSGDGPWFRLEIPLDLRLASARADLGDVRVINADGEALAYSLVTPPSRSETISDVRRVPAFPLYGPAQQPASAARIRVQTHNGGTLVEVDDSPPQYDETLRGWLLDASAMELAFERLSLRWRGADGFQRFRIEASDDLTHWRHWGNGQVVRLSFDGERVEQRELELPGGRARYLRLLWQEGVAPQLDEARLHGVKVSQQARALTWSTALPGKRGEAHEYTWQLPKELPLTHVRLDLPQANMIVPLRLQTRRDHQQHWQTVATGVLFRLSEDGREHQTDVLPLPGATLARELRIQVDPRGGGFGLAEPQLRLAATAQDLVFLARGAAPYALVYGNPDTTSAQLPLTTLMPGNRRNVEDLPLAQLASEAEQLPAPESTSATTPATTTSVLDWRRYGLWAVLLLGVAVVMLMALSLLKQGGGQQP